MKSLMINGTKAYCFDPNLKKLMLMGNKIGDIFFKTVEEKHFMRVVGGYGLQYDAFACFESEGITKVRILERHTGKAWGSKSSDWFSHGHIADYGRGKQIFLSLKYMHEIDKNRIAQQHEIDERERDEIKIQRGLV